MARLALDETVRALLTKTSAVVGRPFFEALARTTAESLGVRWAIVGELSPCRGRVQVLAAWDTDHFIQGMSYALPGTPCEQVTTAGPCQYTADVMRAFPDDVLLAEMGAASYAGIPIPGERGRPIGVLAAMHDGPVEPLPDLEARLGVFAVRAGVEIERLRMEEELRRAQKLELLGQLAGGIIHDLNNMLTPVVACGDLLALELAKTRHVEAALTLRDSAQRAQVLLRSLLAFSRRNREPQAACAPFQVIPRFGGILRRMVPSTIELSLRLQCAPDADHRIGIAAGDLEQVILNLVLNARDACRGEGHVVLTCEVVESSLMLTVEDNGCGMSSEVLERVLEPFFTTKPEGTGTGLGLTSVATRARSAGGNVEVHSAIGQGTRVRVRLPLVNAG